MAISVLTLDELIVNAKAAIRSRFPTRSTHDESWLGKTANALAALLWSLHDKVQQADHDAIPQDKSSYDALAAWAYALGLTDGSTGYGALQATEALGLAVTLTGTPLTVVWNGSGSSPEWVAADGETTFILTAAQSIAADGSTESVTMDANVAGTAGNLKAGDVVTLTSSIPGVDASATVTLAPTTLGTDDEAIGALLDRVLYRLQHQPKAITASDLRTIAEAVNVNGHIPARAYVYPKRSGTGTVDVVVMASGSGQSRRPLATLVSAIDNALDTDRTVSAESTTAIRPVYSSGSAIKVRGTASGAYPWDWDSSSGGPWTIDTVVDTTHLKMNTALPTDFKAAVDAGNKPRIQIKQTGAVLPVIHRCTAYSDSGGKTTVTLETAYTSTTSERATITAPTVGDEVHAGASFVWDIANDILDYVDSLGPSRQSGFADPLDPWEDTIVIDQVRRVALDAADASGVRFLKKMAASNTPTVDGSASDLQATDNGVDIQYLIASSILVVP